MANKHLSCVCSLVLSWREVWVGRAVLGKGCHMLAVENTVKISGFLVAARRVLLVAGRAHCRVTALLEEILSPTESSFTIFWKGSAEPQKFIQNLWAYLSVVEVAESARYDCGRNAG